jgi:membrane-bound metal-dependent hydrolase YbcI (DUF457 family)
MFLGHYAAALLAKRAVPVASLGALVAAAQLPDLVWPVFLLLGWERVEIAPGDTAFTPLSFVHYPWSHSLLLVVVWALAAALAARLRSRPLTVGAVAGALVVSHWVLDVVTHRPDLPLYPGGPIVGLGLWGSVPGTLLVELPMFLGAAWLSLRTVLRPQRVGRLAVGAFLATLLLLYVGNVAGPPPPSPKGVAVVALGQWLLVAWAAWLDRRHVDVVDESGPDRHT